MEKEKTYQVFRLKLKDNRVLFARKVNNDMFKEKVFLTPDTEVIFETQIEKIIPICQTKKNNYFHQ